MATKDKKAIKKTQSKNSEVDERIVSSYYMLAKVVDQNTQMFNAFIEMMSHSPEEEVVQPTPPTPPVEEPSEEFVESQRQADIDHDMIKTLLMTIHKTVGAEAAKAHLKRFGASRISEILLLDYPEFYKQGSAILHKGGDDE